MRVTTTLCSASLLLVSATLAMAQGPSQLHWRRTMPTGSSVEIQGITGDIFAEPSASGELEVTARVGDQPAPDVKVRVVETGDGVKVLAEGKEQTAPGKRVDFIVRVPKGVDFVGRTVNGAIDANLPGANVKAHTVNGSVTIASSKTAQASTVNGPIKAAMTAPFWTTAPDFSTVNGAITLKIPANTRGALKAETRNGKIVAELGRFKGLATDQTVEGRIGGGGGSALTLRSVNGQIEIVTFD